MHQKLSLGFSSFCFLKAGGGQRLLLAELVLLPIVSSTDDKVFYFRIESHLIPLIVLF